MTVREGLASLIADVRQVASEAPQRDASVDAHLQFLVARSLAALLSWRCVTLVCSLLACSRYC